MFIDVSDETVLKLPHLEEIIVLADVFDRPFTVRTEAVLDVFFSPKPLIERAVPSSIISLVYQLLIRKLFKVSLNN